MGFLNHYQVALVLVYHLHLLPDHPLFQLAQPVLEGQPILFQEQVDDLAFTPNLLPEVGRVEEEVSTLADEHDEDEDDLPADLAQLMPYHLVDGGELESTLPPMKSLIVYPPARHLLQHVPYELRQNLHELTIACQVVQLRKVFSLIDADALLNGYLEQ